MENKEFISNRGALVIRAYCTSCKALLQESRRMTKKELRKFWDRAVLGALSIKCDSCGYKFPNFNVELKIYSHITKSEYDVTKYVKLPKKSADPVSLFKDVSKRWLQEHPDCKEPTPEEVRDYLNSVKSVEKSPEELLKEELEKRSKYYS